MWMRRDWMHGNNLKQETEQMERAGKPCADREVGRSMFAAFRDAFAGIATAVRTQRNMRIHLVATALVVAAGCILKVGRGEWIALVICCALVLSMEAANTALEAVVDLASPDVHPLAKKAKDCAAAAVLISAIGAAIVGVIVFVCR